MTDKEIKNLIKLLANHKDQKLSLTKAFENFIDFSNANCREQTILYYQKQWKYASSFFDEINIQFLDDIDLNIMIQMQLHFKRKGYSNNSINKFTEIIKMIYQFNAINNFIDGNPIRDLKKLKKDTEETIIIPKNIKKQIFEWLNRLSNDNIFNLRDKIIIYLLNETGIRLNELLNIKTKNVSLESNTIHLDFTKTGVPRDVYFTNETKKYIELYLKRVEYNVFFFQNLVDHTQMQRVSVNKLLAKIQKELGIEQSISAHKWRHSLATELMNNSVPLKEIQNVLGHTELNTTQKYLHSDNEKTKKDILNVLTSKEI